ncbi:MAG: YVTN family beta-propeller repeat-containing protein [Mucinivorans sp.]
MRRLTICMLLLTVVAQAQPSDTHPLFITDMAPVGQDMVVLSRGLNQVQLRSVEDFTKVGRHWPLIQPTAVAVKGSTAYVTGANNKLFVVDLGSDAAPRAITVGSGAISPVLSGDKVLVLNQFSDNVMEVDPATGTVLRTVKVLREPKGAVLSKDGKQLFVTNFLPAQRADVDYVAAEVSIVNMKDFTVTKNIKLANGSNAVRGIALSEDGRYVFVSHNLGRFTVPTTQLQQGWMNTSAMSVIDAQGLSYVGTVVLDEPDRGAAGIWGIKCVGGNIYVTHSGTHDLSVIPYQPFIDKLVGYKGDITTLDYDLRFMYGMRERLHLEGNGPRAMAAVGGKLFVPTYFSDDLNVVDISDNTVSDIKLVPSRVETPVQQGERMFNDATFCFQNWQSCNGCHPGDARSDGMNWDLQNDGIGNSKNCKSLLYSIQTAPCMISGIRATGELANRKGFTHIQFYDIAEDKALAVDAYIKSLEALPSPYLVEGRLSEKAEAGRKVFEKLGCAECHSGPYFTDLKMHRIGENIEFEAGWDTPTLREVWRTAPYLFDGRAATMREVFELYKHGVDKKLPARELDALTEYVLSL